MSDESAGLDVEFKKILSKTISSATLRSRRR